MARPQNMKLGQKLDSSAAMSTGPSEEYGSSNDPDPEPPLPAQGDRENDGCPHCFHAICVTRRPKDFSVEQAL